MVGGVVVVGVGVGRGGSGGGGSIGLDFVGDVVKRGAMEVEAFYSVMM